MKKTYLSPDCDGLSIAGVAKFEGSKFTTDDPAIQAELARYVTLPGTYQILEMPDPSTIVAAPQPAPIERPEPTTTARRGAMDSRSFGRSR